jgi:HEPN domain-containing protein
MSRAPDFTDKLGLVMRIDPRWWMRAGERDLAMARQLHSGGFHEGTAFHS